VRPSDANLEAELAINKQRQWDKSQGLAPESIPKQYRNIEETEAAAAKGIADAIARIKFREGGK